MVLFSHFDYLPGQGDEDIVERGLRTDKRAKLLRRSDSRKAGIVHHRNPVAQFLGIIHIMRRHDNRGAGLVT